MPRLSLIAYEPVQEQGLYARQFIDDVTGNHDGWTHVIKAVGGFESASFNLRGRRSYLDDWFEGGLMRRVVLYNPQAVPIWEGFVNRMRYSIASLQLSKSMDSLINRVVQAYSPIVPTPPPAPEPSPVVERKPKDPIYDDVDSIARWGVKAVFVSGGEMTAADALAWGQMILNERNEPSLGQSVNTESGSEPRIEIECKGYYHVLRWMPFLPEETHCTISRAEIQAHQVIQEVLQFYSDCVNTGWISTNFGWIDYNYLTVYQQSDERSCWDVIESVINRGGLGGERWVGGIYQGRQMIYKPAEDLGGLYGEYLGLFRSLEDREQKIYDDGSGTEVKPWDMVPDRILRTVDVWG